MFILLLCYIRKGKVFEKIIFKRHIQKIKLVILGKIIWERHYIICYSYSIVSPQMFNIFTVLYLLKLPYLQIFHIKIITIIYKVNELISIPNYAYLMLYITCIHLQLPVQVASQCYILQIVLSIELQIPPMLIMIIVTK